MDDTIKVTKMEVNDDNNNKISDDDTNTTTSSSINNEDSSENSDDSSEDSDEDDISVSSYESYEGEEKKPKQKKTSSKLYIPYRTIGIITNGNGFTYNNGGEEDFLYIPIGNRFQIVKCDKLTPVLTSDPIPTTPKSEITKVISDTSMNICLALHTDNTCISLFKRTAIVDTLNLNDVGDGNLKCNYTFELGRIMYNDEQHLFIVLLCTSTNDGSSDSSSDSDSDSDSSSNEVQSKIIILASTKSSIKVHKVINTNVSDEIVAGCHPSTYINKILIGGKNSLQLYNYNKGKCIYTFTCLPSHDIVVITSTPAIDVVAVGTKQGSVHFINIKLDTLLFTLSHEDEITSVSFRTTSNDTVPPSVSISLLNGYIYTWDLSTKLLIHKFQAHEGGVATSLYLPIQPILLTIGKTSNSIKMYIFDQENGTTCRLLKSRSGHVSDPTNIQFKLNQNHISSNSIGVDASQYQILSSASKVLRMSNIFRPNFDFNYSASNVVYKDTTCFSTIESICIYNDHVVTNHKYSSFVYVWNTSTKSQKGCPVLHPFSQSNNMSIKYPASYNATALTVSSCGNYVLVGTNDGTLYRYNIQSGLLRCTYPKCRYGDLLEKKNEELVPGSVARSLRLVQGDRGGNGTFDLDKLEEIKGKKKEEIDENMHKGKIVGVFVDALNRNVISIGEDKQIISWDFVTSTYKQRLQLPYTPIQYTYNKENNIVAIATSSSNDVYIIDISIMKYIRKFTDIHTDTITDVKFSPDGRRIYTSSKDKTIRVFDLPTSTCIDYLMFRNHVTSMDISPHGDYLATSHNNDLGICLWKDKSFFSNVCIDGNVERACRMDFDGWIEHEEDDISENGNQQDDTNNEIKPKDKGLITFSDKNTIPTSHWKNLFHLELIKERNKPIQPPVKPKSAPFFLQWRPGQSLTNDAVVGGKKEKSEDEEWAAAWDDDSDEEMEEVEKVDEKANKKNEMKSMVIDNEKEDNQPKKSKITHSRSQLISILLECHENKINENNKESTYYQPVTKFLSTLNGPSAIDIALSSLCYGTHDIKEGPALEYLYITTQWFIESMQLKEEYEVMNAYLYRFSYLHGTTIMNQVLEDGGGEELLEAMRELRKEHYVSSRKLHEKCQYTLCLLRHFLQMV